MHSITGLCIIGRLPAPTKKPASLRKPAFVLAEAVGQLIASPLSGFSLRRKAE